MKIDVHVHTKKIKKGDATTREIDSRRFHEIISSTEVKIVAITNHNHFDLTQYNDFNSVVGDSFQIWPGVELDILEDARRGHLLVIVSPKHAQSLEKIMQSLTRNQTADAFSISIDNLLSNFDKLNPLYIVHYKKQPDLSEDDIGKIVNKTAYKNRVLKEATNAISAGIFLAHGHSSIYGSDVQDWDKYQALSNDLPDLRLPVESFEQFCLLLNKDQASINTLLSKKTSEEISIRPFEDGKILKIKIYGDINIFFGAKGTGKSKILEAIANYYTSKGIRARKFEFGPTDLGEIYDLNCKKISIDLKDHGVDYCKKEIDFIRKAEEVDVTSLSRYQQFYSKESKNKKAKTIKIKDFSAENPDIFERNLKSIKDVHERFIKFQEYLKTDKSVKEYVDKADLSGLLENLTKIIRDLEEKRLNKFMEYWATCLFNNLIQKVKEEVAIKTGTAEKPTTTGFHGYALNRIKIELAVKFILGNINKEIPKSSEYIGNLDEKGDLYCKTEIVIQNGSIRDGRFDPIAPNVRKSSQQDFSKKVKSINDALYSPQLFKQISELNNLEGIDSIPTIYELLMVERCFILNEEQYEASTGEQSMLLLHRELKEDKDVYILDEPEKSLGNEYINNVIVPLIKEKAKLGKKVFIATHDANIAVRTLPYNSIFREHKKDGYETFIGNPFLNYLENIRNQDDKKDWKEISMRTLEGGRNAFGERGQIYGNP